MDYLCLDVCVYLMSFDPYFKGETIQATLIVHSSISRDSFSTRSYRLFLDITGLYASVGMYCVGFGIVAIGVLGESWLATDGEPWMYLSVYGSLQDGL